MKFYGKRGKRGAKRATTKRAKKSVPKITAAVKTYVNKAIHRNIENKFFNQYGLNQAITCANATTPININLLPINVQGTNSSQRIGDTIRIVKGVVRGFVNLMPWNATTNPYSPAYIKMWLISSKQATTANLSSTNIANNFFDLSGGTAPTGFQGSLIDIMAPVNRDEWICYRQKVIKVGQPTAASGNSATGGWVGITDNRSITYPFVFDYSKHIKKPVKYAEGSSYPTDRNMWLIFQVAYADGRADTPASPAEFHYTLDITYEDA